MSMGALSPCSLCTMCMPGALGDQKRVLDPLGMDFEMVVRTWNTAWVLAEQPVLSHLSSPVFSLVEELLRLILEFLLEQQLKAC